ncbi:zinc ribbon domain-containing protein [Micromonospora fluostatini]|uniref:zinc ribbon domain-containing protein n=1 Tax=Micromonospora sp. JCM 30529 TaxID=3421643 RepID=UPI003D18557F
MRFCDNCGAEVVPGDDFCGNCGAFLAWDAADDTTPQARPAPAGTGRPPTGTDDAPTGTRHPDPAPGTDPAPAPDPEPQPDPGPQPDPDPQPDPGPQPDPDPQPDPGPQPVPGQRAGAAADRTGWADDADDSAPPEAQPDPPPPPAPDSRRAAALVVPVRPATAGDDAPADPTATVPTPVDRPAADQPRAVQPGRPVAPAPVVRDFAGDRPGGPDDVVCPHCGTGNARGRSFCRRCGRPLDATAQPAATVPWWRRLRWPRRRSGGGWLRRLLAVLLVLALIAALALVAVRFGRPVLDTIRDRTATPEAILPTEVTASSEARGHPARSTVDGLNNRYWAPATDQPAAGQYVELTFDPPIRLLDLIVHTGASPQQDDFVRQARPAELTMTLWTRDGTRTTTPLRLTDRPGPQTFHHVAGDVTRLRLTIGAVYGQERGRRVALAEVEVFRRP